MPHLTKSYDRNGSGWMRERCFFGVHFFRRYEDQKWSQTMAERRREYGVRILGVRLAISWVDRHWHEVRGYSVDRCITREF